MFGHLSLRLLAAVASVQLVHAVPADPADPTITPPAVLQARQQDARFMGYFYQTDIDEWSSFDCNPGLTWYQSGDYAQCCPTTLASCPAATACMSGSQVYPLPELSTTTTIACSENYGSSIYSICNTILIFENSLDSDPRTNIVCGNSALGFSMFRSIDTTRVVSTTDSDSDSNTFFGSASRVTSASASRSSTAAASAPSEKSSSKAWIAGAVVGPILGLALIGLGLCFCLRRKKSKRAPIVPQQGTAMAPANPSQPPAGVAGFTDTKPQFASPQQPYYDPHQSQPVPQSYPHSQPQPYPQQGGFSGNVSPAPHYATPVYAAPASPPPQQTQYAPSSPQSQQAYAHDAKMAHASGDWSSAAELGGESTAPHAQMPQGGGVELQGSGAR